MGVQTIGDLKTKNRNFNNILDSITPRQGSATKGIATVSLKYQKPVAFGLLTTDTIDQAIERAGT